MKYPSDRFEAARVKRWRIRRVLTGLCMRCKAGAAPGKKFCEACLEKRRVEDRERNLRKKGERLVGSQATP